MAKFIDEISYMNRVVELMKNEYGNFVIQKALKLSQNLNRKRLVKLIQKNVDKIGDKKLVVKWKNIVNSFVNTNVVFNRNSNPAYVLGCSLQTTPNAVNNYSSGFIGSGLTSPFSMNDPKMIFSPQYSVGNISAGFGSGNSNSKKGSNNNLPTSNVQSNAYYCFYEPK